MKYVVASATCIQLCCYFILAKILQFSVTSFSELAALPYLVVVLNIRDKVVIYDETRWPIYVLTKLLEVTFPTSIYSPHHLQE